MTDHDRYSDELRSLAQLGEDNAEDGWSAERVRRMGTQRRRRRAIVTVVAASVAAVTLGGGVVFSAAMRSGSTNPEPAQSPTASATATATDLPTTAPSTTNEPAPPTLTKEHLLQTSDIKTYSAEAKILITDPDVGRPPDDDWVCLTQGWKPLGAEETLNRNFRISVPGEGRKPTANDPQAQQPSMYTHAFQFADAETATQAYEAFDSLVNKCGTVLRDRGYTPLGDPSTNSWIAVKTGVPDTKGRFYEFTYRTPKDDPDAGWFESVGLTLAGDRLMVSVTVQYGQDKNVGLEQFPKGGADVGIPHEQFGLIVAAAKRLTS